jgi:hypothetical protein
VFLFLGKAGAWQRKNDPLIEMRWKQGFFFLLAYVFFFFVFLFFFGWLSGHSVSLSSNRRSLDRPLPLVIARGLGFFGQPLLFPVAAHRFAPQVQPTRHPNDRLQCNIRKRFFRVFVCLFVFYLSEGPGTNDSV